MTDKPGMEKKKIRLFADWYEPGYKAGGPIRSCVNFSRHMKAHYRIYVITTDRDLGSAAAYENIRADTWTSAEEGVEIWYSSPQSLGRALIREQIASVQPDYIYLNSMFSKYFTIYPLMVAGRGHQAYSIVLSPRGMLRASALGFKPAKKRFFLGLMRGLGFHRRIHFIACDETEKNDIRLHFGQSIQVTQIPNFPGILPPYPDAIIKRPDELSMVFVGRIHPIKNLDYLLNLLARFEFRITLTIIGSLEDKSFWEECLRTIGNLPPHIRVHYEGEMANRELPAIISRHHIFVLPTKGENFGHAIMEALALGKPVLISDQTPWRHLREAKAGWDLALQDPSGFESAIREAAKWGQSEYDGWSAGAYSLAEKKVNNNDTVEKYRTIFV